MSALRSQACERCWRRKQKCSRDAPVCVQCREASATCIPRGFGPTLDNGDIASETGIEALKGRIRSMQMRLQVRSHHGTPVMPSPRTHVSHHEATISPSNTSVAETLAAQSHHEMQDDVAYLSLSAMAERTDSQILSTEGLSYLTMLYAATGISGSDPTLPRRSNEALSGSLAEFRKNGRLADIDLGSTEMTAAFQHYVDMIGQTFPYTTSAELFEYRDSALTRHGNNNGGQPLAEQLAIAYLGTATGLLLGAHYTYKEMLATDLAVRAVRLMPKIIEYSGKLPAIRCLTALVIYSLYTTFGGSTWHLLGLTMTRCISAGLHTIRFSDYRSQNDEQRAGSRLLWTLYILDTSVSTSLDRPFSLNDHDIMISPPSSPSSREVDANVEEATFRHLIQHAQIIRSIRQTAKPDDGILCHYVNIRHWMETVPPHAQISKDHVISLCSKAYVELLKHTIFLHDLERPSILNQVTGEFGSYLDRIEEQLNDQQDGAVSGLEALHIFAMGIILTTEPHHPGSGILHQDATVQKIIMQVQSCLTLFSTRYSVMRKYRDIIFELQRFAANSASSEKLHTLIASSELAVPSRIQQLILEFLSSTDA